MPKSGGRMRIIEHRTQAIDLSRTDTGLIRLRVGSRVNPTPEQHFDLYPGDARVLAHSLLAAALREPREPNERGERGSPWPEEYYAEGTFPGEELRKPKR